MSNLWDDIVGDSGDAGSEEDAILAPLLDDINLIQDHGIRSFVRALLLSSSTFWVIPASFSGFHHPPDERKEGGNVLHTQRVVRIVKLLGEAQERDQFEIDQLIAAALLHDLTKGVLWDDGEIHYDPMHPLTVDRLYAKVRAQNRASGNELESNALEVEEEVIFAIMRMVRCSHGKWGIIPEVMPITILECTLHWADYLSANLHFIVDKEPVDERWGF